MAKRPRKRKGKSEGGLKLYLSIDKSYKQNKCYPAGLHDYYYAQRYAKKFCEEGTEEYEKGFFLDCCALLRQVTQDLENEWGWTLGRWNQTYQYALCIYLPMLLTCYCYAIPSINCIFIMLLTLFYFYISIY